MNISFSWLQEYLKVDLTPEQIAEILTSIGLEVGHIEMYESIKGGLEGLVIGEVKTCVPHENSDHLNITTVDIGASEPLQVVCGASNIDAGQKVVVATVGTKLYSGEDSFTIKRSKIRGVESFGMICAEDEIGVGSSHDGIMVLPQDVAVGTLAKDYFGVERDTIIEVDITPNRADAISHYGVARDLYAYCIAHGIEATLQRPQYEHFVQKKDNNINVVVENPQHCKRYVGVSMSGIRVGKSPKWLQNRLLSVGVRPVNNVVDITNYVMFAFGQPLHAFDIDKIEGKGIVVRNAHKDEKIVMLDEVERTLCQSDLVICDTQKPMCLAGVFGGLHSGVSNATTSIFLESAYFDSVSVRMSAKRYALNTDSSFRFERGVNPHDTLYAIRVAVDMIQAIANGTIEGDLIDIYPQDIEDFRVVLSLKKLHALIGKKISVNTIETILKGLEISVFDKKEEGNDTIYHLNVPSYRVDVQRDVDVIEDILRIYGYNNIEISDSLRSNISYRQLPDNHKTKNLVSEQLTANGFYEIMNNPLSKSAYYEKLTKYPKEHSVKILNSLSQELNVMRQTLLFGGLESISRNANRQNSNLKFYEFGNCFEYCKEKENSNDVLDSYVENEQLGIWITGKRHSENWLRKGENSSIYDAIALVENILQRLGVARSVVREFEDQIFGQGLEYVSQSNIVFAQVGAVSKDMLKAFNIKDDVFYADIKWNILLSESTKKQIKYKEISKFPEVSRDLALLLNKNISFEAVKTIAYQTEKKLLQKVTLFDVYEGDNIEADKKSYAVNFILQDREKTLTDKQIDAAMRRLQHAFEEKLSATIR
ncbi:MAG: phenylalanine--tRNA ligase subunit beta [Bacteroidales bacterium]|nr:MAG: phenylalanine--tRNA ligase subunit beta [Bacteroidales bacterium]